MNDRLVYRIAYRLADRRYDRLLAAFANVIIGKEDVDPQQYHKEHGRCPRGYHWDGTRCQPTDEKASDQEPKGVDKAEDAAKRVKRQQEKKEESRVALDGLQEAVKAGKLKGTPKQHFTLARDLQKKHAGSLKKMLGELQELAPTMKAKGRVKTVGSAVGKLVRKPDNYQSAKDLQDFTGTRLVGESIDEVMSAVEAIKKKYKVIDEDDYISKPNGDYRSYHLIVEDENGLAKEVQVRTRNQDVFADWAHDVYKPVNEAQRRAAKNPKIKKVIDEFSNRTSEFLFAKDQGKSTGGPPPCPDEVQKFFSCPEL